MTSHLLLDTVAAARAERAHGLQHAGPRPLSVSCITSTRAEDRTRPYHCVSRIGSVVRVQRFASERDRDLYADQARADVALLAEHLHAEADEAR